MSRNCDPTLKLVLIKKPQMLCSIDHNEYKSYGPVHLSPHIKCNILERHDNYMIDQKVKNQKLDRHRGAENGNITYLLLLGEQIEAVGQRSTHFLRCLRYLCQLDSQL